MGDPKKHHFLAKFYLGYWARDGRVVQFSKPFGDRVKPYSVHAAGTGYINRLYEMQVFPPDVAQRVEKEFFSPVDSRAAQALQHMLTFDGSELMPKGYRRAWIEFLQSLQFRMPEDIHALKANVRDDWIMSIPEMQESYAKVRRQEDPEKLRDFLDQQDERIYQESAFNIAMRMIRHQNVATTINEMKWSIVHLDRASFELLTSDRPVIMTEQLGHLKSLILLPVGPRRLFAAVASRECSRWLRSSTHDQLATMVNRHVVGNADRLVIGSDGRQLRFIQNRMGRDRKPTMLARLRALRRNKAAKVGS